MNASELALKMLEWEQKRRELDALELEIAAAVLDREKTQTVGNVRVLYFSGRKTYNYEGAAQTLTPDRWDELVPKHTEEVTNWRAVCKEAGVEVPYTQGSPCVSFKLTE